MSRRLIVKKIIRHDDPRVRGRNQNVLLDTNWWCQMSRQSRRAVSILQQADSTFHSVEIVFPSAGAIQDFEHRLASV